MEKNATTGPPLPPPWKKIAARSGDQVWIVDGQGNTVAVVHREFADLILRLVTVQCRTRS